LEKERRLENAIAEIGFGDRAKTGDRSTVRHAPGFILSHVGRMDEAPAAIDGRMVEKPVDGALS
jgi:hypothetical protein